MKQHFDWLVSWLVSLLGQPLMETGGSVDQIERLARRKESNVWYAPQAIDWRAD
jgi:hypothetical protein